MAGTKPIAILVALKEEERAVLSRFGHRGWLRAGPYDYRRGKIAGEDVLLVRTGIGAARAGECAARLLEVEDPRLVIMAGFGGGLRSDLRTGDLVVASEVLDLAPGDVEGQSPEAEGERLGEDTAAASAIRSAWTSPPDLVERAARLTAAPPATWPFRVVSGRIITAARVVASAAGKRALGDRLGASVVDMESGAVFQIAAGRGIPALSIRAVLDDADRDIPFDFGRLLTPTGRPRPFRFLEALVWEPEKIRDLVDLRARARTAAESIAAYAPRLIDELAAR